MYMHMYMCSTNGDLCVPIHIGQMLMLHSLNETRPLGRIMGSDKQGEDTITVNDLLVLFSRCQSESMSMSLSVCPLQCYQSCLCMGFSDWV